ncbi:MAG: BLUF domain-containing protein, partial [Caldimonas sp.]
ITGLLVFDGHAFCQFVEGPRRSILGLHERLAGDPRHAGMRTLHVGPTVDPARRFPSWRLGYAFVADPAAIRRLSGSAGESAVDAFAELVPALGGDDSQ